MRAGRWCATLALGLALVGCATSGGDKTREKAMLPAMVLAWPGIEEDVSRGLNDAVQDGDLHPDEALGMDQDANALEAALHDSLAVAREVTAREWPPLHPFALRGVQDRVDDGEIVEGVAESRRERIKNFQEDFTALQGGKY